MVATNNRERGLRRVVALTRNFSGNMIPARFEDEYDKAAEILQDFYAEFGTIPEKIHISFIRGERGRNDRCPCGSGRKQRKCCGA